MTKLQPDMHIANIDLLLSTPEKNWHYLSIGKDESITNHWFKKNQQNDIYQYVQKQITHISEKIKRLDSDTLNNVEQIKFIQLQRLTNQINYQFDNTQYFKHQQIDAKKISLENENNPFKQNANNLPHINYDQNSKTYTSPDDEKAHHHRLEAFFIGVSTQWERFKAFIHRVLRFFGIYVWEKTEYFEHDYKDEELYAHDFAINSRNPKQQSASHYWIGHASNLIEIPIPNSKALHVLTDPIEGDINSFAYPRMTKEGSKIEGIGKNMLPNVDVVVISHNHRDHVDTATLKNLLPQQPIMVVPEGDKNLFESLGFKKIIDVKWWEQARITVNENFPLTITAVPANHWSGRGCCDAHCSAVNGYVLQANTIDDTYFAGDTALMKGKSTAAIFDNFAIKTLISPGGPDEKREAMQSTHQCSADAILMHFKCMLNIYNKLKTESSDGVSLATFQEETQKIKSIYNHTGTFKLGNLRARDTFYSMHRLIVALKEGNTWAQRNLRDYELDVYNKLNGIIDEMPFKQDAKLTNEYLINLINTNIVIPKIGQRQNLINHNGQIEDYNNIYRDIIINKRGLQSCINTIKSYSEQKEVTTSELCTSLLHSYANPGFFHDRHHIDVAREYTKKFADEKNSAVTLRQFEEKLGKVNPHGHMHAVLSFCKWIQSIAVNNSVSVKTVINDSIKVISYK